MKLAISKVLKGIKDDVQINNNESYINKLYDEIRKLNPLDRLIILLHFEGITYVAISDFLISNKKIDEINDLFSGVSNDDEDKVLDSHWSEEDLQSISIEAVRKKINKIKKEIDGGLRRNS